MTSRDGYYWTRDDGLVKGIPSIGVIQPPTNLSSDSQPDFDVIVLGGGYTGLTAIRDLTLAGYKTLLLEARDRIGGRSWSSNLGGYPFEMGGTWVSWRQPHVWREISRYSMRDHLEISQNYDYTTNHFTLTTEDGVRDMSHQEEDELMDRALRKLMNIDGAYGRIAMPFPHNESYVKDCSKYDSLSLADRMKQIEGEITPDERAAIYGMVLLCSCGNSDNTSFYEFLHWWALCGYSWEGCVEDLMKYKFEGGQSSFAINFFKEADSTGKLAYRFNTIVTSVEDDGSTVSVKSADGQCFKAPQVISAIPLNVLGNVSFSPRLSCSKEAAVSIGHINKCAKVHGEYRGTDLRSWSGINLTNSLNYAFGDGMTPLGNAHVVAFGCSMNQLHPEKDIDATKQSLHKLAHSEIDRIVFHNWVTDEYAQGAWFFSSPGFVTKYLTELRASHGNVHFACSDWAVGWRSFIDGAIEEGTRAALTVTKNLRQLQGQK